MALSGDETLVIEDASCRCTEEKDADEDELEEDVSGCESYELEDEDDDDPFALLTDDDCAVARTVPPVPARSHAEEVEERELALALKASWRTLVKDEENQRLLLSLSADEEPPLKRQRSSSTQHDTNIGFVAVWAWAREGRTRFNHEGLKSMLSLLDEKLVQLIVLRADLLNAALERVAYVARTAEKFVYVDLALRDDDHVRVFADVVSTRVEQQGELPWKHMLCTNNRFGLSGALQVGWILSQPMRLVTIELGSTTLGSAGVQAVLFALATRPYNLDLLKLDLSRCGITNEGATGVASEFRRWASHLSFLKLRLNGNSLRKGGLLEIAHSLCNIAVLKKLEMSSNLETPAESQEVSAALFDGTASVRTVNLSDGRHRRRLPFFWGKRERQWRDVYHMPGKRIPMVAPKTRIWMFSEDSLFAVDDQTTPISLLAGVLCRCVMLPHNSSSLSLEFHACDIATENFNIAVYPAARQLVDAARVNAPRAREFSVVAHHPRFILRERSLRTRGRLIEREIQVKDLCALGASLDGAQLDICMMRPEAPAASIAFEHVKTFSLVSTPPACTDDVVWQEALCSDRSTLYNQVFFFDNPPGS